MAVFPRGRRRRRFPIRFGHRR